MPAGRPRRLARAQGKQSRQQQQKRRRSHPSCKTRGLGFPFFLSFLLSAPPANKEKKEKKTHEW
jgi:hypothetical protein